MRGLAELSYAQLCQTVPEHSPPQARTVRTVHVHVHVHCFYYSDQFCHPPTVGTVFQNQL